MDPSDDSQATQPATQNAFDPRRIGQQNSGFSDQDISDIICLLYPISEAASDEVRKIASSPQYKRYTAGRYTAEAIESDLTQEDDAREFGRNRGLGDHALVLRLSSSVKNPRLGFTFGRNHVLCDICFANDPRRRLSNIHFRIYVNDHGTVLLEDQSTNGTVVDSKLLKMKSERPGPLPPRRTLQSGSTIKVPMHVHSWDLTFLVRIPRREGDLEEEYLRNVAAYINRATGGESDLNKTIGPGPSGHVDLFGPARAAGLTNNTNTTQSLQGSVNRLPREWRGGDKYARVGMIGKGAFATVHKVTSKYDGAPYAAKELDKRKFIKNGVLDQKVENEMKIMQKVQHANIVQYIEHFDWDAHQFIIIMEYVPGGDLGKFIQEHGAIAEPHVQVIADQLVDALGYLHENRITHRDVKPDNILIHSIDPLVVKLTDFGLSKMIDTEQTFLKTFCGTLLYCAPEVYTEYSSYDDHGRRTNRKNHRHVNKERYDHAVDIWSLGGVLFYTLTSSPPFPVKNGTSYTALLDHIIKTPLNTAPLVTYNVSRNGIHFLSRMIHVRPETRATIAELKSHAWLNEPASSLNDEAEDALDYSASQLSLNDGRSPRTEFGGHSSLGEPEPDFSMDYESGEENDTFGQPHAPRLFGEVSDVGSSGVVPEERLNLPVSFDRLSETESDGFEVRDSFEESDEFSTPQANKHSAIGPSQPDNSRSALLGIGSQSLGGASSIFQNLHMKSLADNDLVPPSSRKIDFTSSKRKVFDDASDEYDTSNSNLKPSMKKRLKSEGDVADLEGELELFRCIPKMVKSESGRQIDFPLPKTTYWDSQDESTWDLNYPEMTHLQYKAFEIAAKKRNEVFARGKTPLWDLAMKYFPPTSDHNDGSARTILAIRAQNSHHEDFARETGDGDMPATASPGSVDGGSDHYGASERARSSVSPALRVTQPFHAAVGTFKSDQQSSLAGISFPLDGPVLSWGREEHNTVVYEQSSDKKVPKYAFRVILWRDGYKAGVDELRPWEPARSTMINTTRESPMPDSYAFYIATKATHGIRINGNLLFPHDPKDATDTAPCKNWMKLYNGDHIAFFGGVKPRKQARLIFECSWGGSAMVRPDDEPPTCVAPSLAQKLDRLWPKAAKALRFSQIKERAQREYGVRMHNMPREEARSRDFELRRLDALEMIASREFSQLNPDEDTAGRAQSS